MPSLKRKHEDLKRAAKAPGQTKLLFVQPVTKTKEVSIKSFFNWSLWNLPQKHDFLPGLKKPNTNNFT